MSLFTFIDKCIKLKIVYIGWIFKIKIVQSDIGDFFFFQIHFYKSIFSHSIKILLEIQHFVSHMIFKHTVFTLRSCTHRLTAANRWAHSFALYLGGDCQQCGLNLRRSWPSAKQAYYRWGCLGGRRQITNSEGFLGDVSGSAQVTHHTEWIFFSSAPVRLSQSF